MISVVIPAYNEAPSIGETVLSIRAVLNNSGQSSSEIIVVDDGSTDSTAAQARISGAIVIRHPKNAGYGFALKSGISAAAFDTIVITDADLTYPADAIPNLIQEYYKGFDMVVAARSGKHYHESVIKMPLRMVLKLLVEFTAGRKIPDVNSGLRVFSRKAILPHFPHLCNTFSFTTSLTLAFMMVGRFVQYVPIEYHPRIGQTKVRLLRDSVRTLQYITQAIVYYNPMKLFLMLSLTTLGLSAIALIIGLNLHDQICLSLSANSVLLAICLFGMGLIADLIRQTNLGKSSINSAEAQPIDFSVPETQVDRLPAAQAALLVHQSQESNAQV
ncbi:MAG: glycosyltransferase family 2 protein [Cyanobacteria bacterium PR.3.49]|nr:glycosyltransferase family 2 protein [Cyanobacteria bacterium PR.3.49]